MNDFVRRLPLRLAALSGLVIGGISLAGGTDPWICLIRVGAAFACFGLLGLALRSQMEHGQDASKTAAQKGANVGRQEPAPPVTSDETASVQEGDRQRSDAPP